jgi:hypothetical protein
MLQQHTVFSQESQLARSKVKHAHSKKILVKLEEQQILNKHTRSRRRYGSNGSKEGDYLPLSAFSTIAKQLHQILVPHTSNCFHFHQEFFLCTAPAIITTNGFKPFSQLSKLC